MIVSIAKERRSRIVLALIDEELARLQQVRELLGTNGTRLVNARKKRKNTRSRLKRGSGSGEAIRKRWAARKEESQEVTSRSMSDKKNYVQ
jgi:hypothetical protein